jgi:IS5 family transposase
MRKTKKKQKHYYSGKKKRHTLKTQVIVSSTGAILSIRTGKGKTHDFKLFKESKESKRVYDKAVLADSGYQGIAKICPNATIPHKRKMNTPLTSKQKQDNNTLSSKRIIVEMINAKIKVFKIVKYPYRNRRKRFGLRMNLICGIINLDNKQINGSFGDGLNE